MELKITKTTTPKQKPDQTKLGFGNYYTDHMFIMNYDEGQGWHDARIVPYGPFELDPSSMVLHYAQECFEGMKAYRTVDGKIQLFRPEKNMARMNLSCERLCIPTFDGDFVIKAIKELVKIDQDWIPTEKDTSLYIRPFVFAVDHHVGVHPAKHLIFSVILSPVGAYYEKGLEPVKIFVEQKYVRAVIGGTGFTKAGANYAISLKGQEEAAKEGYEQTLWLDGVERKYVEEVGSMNVMFVLGDEVITPELRGSILGGITRMSIVELLKAKGYKVSERLLSIDEIVEAFKKGELREAFGTGTAAVISPIGELKYGDLVMPINDGKIGPISQMLYDTLTGIQWGRIPDEFGWTQVVE
ncbi:MAG: branched-chain amino acid aminotransferase [Ruminiclostridium sp.]|nr:branched-chain amino acid aminotransferase [Ruminiclostridium sp.]